MAGPSGIPAVYGDSSASTIPGTSQTDLNASQNNYNCQCLSISVAAGATLIVPSGTVLREPTQTRGSSGGGTGGGAGGFIKSIATRLSYCGRVKRQGWQSRIILLPGGLPHHCGLRDVTFQFTVPSRLSISDCKAHDPSQARPRNHFAHHRHPGAFHKT